MLLQAYLVISAFVLIMGCCIGSFLNVIIYRLPLGLNIAKGRSFCPQCKATIKPYDLIPVLSYIILGGKCRNCHDKISLRYPAVELICGLFALYLCWGQGMNLHSICLFALFCLLLAVALMDHDTMTIPDSMHIALAVVAIAMCFTQTQVSLLERGIGFFAVSLPMFLLCLAIGNAFGGGDIKLMAVCGAILGWKNVLLATFIAVVLAGIVAVFMVIVRKTDRKSHMAFGPYLSMGIMVAALWGNEILSWYLGLCMR